MSRMKPLSLDTAGMTVGNLENLWSCFGCDYLGEDYDNDPEDDSEMCPVCGCHAGDGFGMAENDPRYRDDD